LNGPPAPSLVDPATVGTLTPVDVYRRITIGVAGTAMPEFEASLTEDDRWAVTAYVASLSAGGSSAAVRAALREAAVFLAVRRQLDSAVALGSERIAFDAYLAFEQVETTVRARDAALASRLEAGFFALRQRAAGGANAGGLRAIHQELLSDLEHAERVVTERAFGTALLVPSLLLLVREGFEAIVIIAALMTFLAKSGAPERRREVVIGVGAAVGASVVTAVLFELLLENTPGPRAALEGITMLVATAVLFSVSYWLLSKIEADKWSAFLKTRLQVALASGSGAALASVAFLAVYREGVETILFYRALLLSGGDGAVGSVAAGAAIGAVVLVLLYVAMTRLGLRIRMKPFFAVTGLLLYAMAFVFAGKGIAELQEGRIVATTVLPSVQWLRVPALGIYPTMQSLGLQAILVVLALVAAMAALRRKDSNTPVAGAQARS
ncbi:MAG: FTR1 family protein, partial [Gemmatimonadales bacterium]